MLPQSVLSSSAVAAQLLLPNPQPSPLESLHRGGAAIGDAALGLNVQTWKLSYALGDFILADENGATSVVFSSPDVTECSLAFDQNMRPFVAFFDGQAKFRWFDPTVPGFVTTSLPNGSANPRCTLDDNRPETLAQSDIILSYVRTGTLFFRAQRDRFLVEYVLGSGFSGLNYVGMGKNLRLQFSVTT